MNRKDATFFVIGYPSMSRGSICIDSQTSPATGGTRLESGARSVLRVDGSAETNKRIGSVINVTRAHFVIVPSAAISRDPFVTVNAKLYVPLGRPLVLKVARNEVACTAGSVPLFSESVSELLRRRTAGTEEKLTVKSWSILSKFTKCCVRIAISGCVIGREKGVGREDEKRVLANTRWKHMFNELTFSALTTWASGIVRMSGYGVGAKLGKGDGIRDGTCVGDGDGNCVGTGEGGAVGKLEGACEGGAVGTFVGYADGVGVGNADGSGVAEI